ncbi:MAG: hypothetical protein NZ992_04170, partial [Candidatus Korarchaeum sp.]|nr:hypothetical protein [Candidatus Korarchaeum sp.]MDW8035828.1 hypothetical protein [Candidatus Korarchaeum sp.]
ESNIVEVEGALALPSVKERELFEVLLEFGDPVIPGFGCSDSKDLTHLFKLEDPTRLKEFLLINYSAQELRLA